MPLIAFVFITATLLMQVPGVHKETSDKDLKELNYQLYKNRINR